MLPVLRRLAIPVVLPPVDHVGNVTRARLILEVVAAYLPLARVLRSNDVQAMVRAARTDAGKRIVVAPEDAQATAIRLGKVVQSCLRVLPMDSRCLIRSLVLIKLLHQRSIEAKLLIGVHPEGAFGAHAWVETGGLPVLPYGRVARLVEL